MTNQRKYSIADVRLAIEAVGSSPKAIADHLGCTRGTVYRYLRKYPELRAAYEADKGDPIEERKKFSREDVEAAIRESHGVKSAVAGLLECSRQTVDNYLADWPDLVGVLEGARGGLIGKAVSALVADVENAESDGHVRAYMYVLKTLAKDDGFSERTEITGADGEGLFDLQPETVRLIQAMGMDMSQVAKQFDQMVRVAAAQRGLIQA